MTTKPTNGNKAKFFQTILGAVAIALLTSTGGMIYKHEVTILEQSRDISKLRARVYRERIRDYQFHERYARAIIQTIKTQASKDGGLSVIEKTRLNFFESQKELIQEEKSNYVETWKHEGQ